MTPASAPIATAGKRIVLAYSGGLETSIAIPWLAERHAAEIIAMTIDLGQGKEALEEIRDRALATGALRAHVVDVRELFARDYIVRALKAGILGDLSPIAASLAHPLIAQKVVEIANIEQATTVAHGDPAGSASPLDRTIRALDPMMTVLAPAGEWQMTQERQLDYARDRHVTLPVEFSGLGDRASAPRSVVVRAGEPASVDIAFERGAPVGVNGVTMPLLDLISSLGIIAGAHGVTSLAALHAAHDALERAAVASPGEFSSPRIAASYLVVLREGRWFTPAREMLDAEADKVQRQVSGAVRLTLFEGACAVGDIQIASVPRTVVLARATAED
jgi:argininosuccinate synthase